MSNGPLTLSEKAMDADRLAALGLSIGLHGCMIALIATTIGTMPGRLSGPTVTVSLDMPIVVEQRLSSAVPEVVAPSRIEESQPALRPVTPPPAMALAPIPLDSPARSSDAMAPEPLEPVAPISTAQPQPAPLVGPVLENPEILSDAASVSKPLPPLAAMAPLQSVAATPEAATPQTTFKPAPLSDVTTTIRVAEAAPSAPEAPAAAPAETRIEPPVVLAESPTTKSTPAELPADPGPGPGPNAEAPIQPLPSAAEPPAASLPASAPATAAAQVVNSLAPPPALTPASPSEGVTIAMAFPAPEAGPAGSNPSAPPLTDGSAAARIQKIRGFLDHYDGGACFVATTGRVSDPTAEIDSFSSAPDKFTTLDRAFRAATGVEAVVAGQRVWSPQCPAVDYLRRLPPNHETGPVLEIERDDVGGGDLLAGRIRGTTDRRLGLFVISEAGAVEDVSGSLVAHDRDTVTFAFPPRRQGAAGGPFPQMLVAIAADRALPSHPTSVSDLFDPLLAAGTDGLAVTAKLFLLTR